MSKKKDNNKQTEKINNSLENNENTVSEQLSSSLEISEIRDTQNNGFESINQVTETEKVLNKESSTFTDTTIRNNKKTESHKSRTIISKVNLVKPFIYTTPSISVICIRFFILLMIQIIMLGITKSYSALQVVATSFAGAVCAGSLSFLIFKEPIYNNFPTIIQGLLIGLLLPESYPLVTTFFIVFIVIFICRCMVFKSVNSWVNISALAIIIAWFIGSQYFPSFLISENLVTLKNPSVYMIQNGTFNIYGFDSTITQFLNAHIFRFLKVNLPEGFISLLWDTHSTIPAFRFNLLTILASIILFSDNSMQPVIPSLFLLVYGVLVRLFAPIFFGGYFNSGDVILAMLTSGTLFTAIFLLQWFGTIPITFVGKIIYGILGGIVAFLITGCGTSPIGMCYTILVCNLINLMICFFEEKNNKLLLKKVIAKTLSSYPAFENAKKEL